MEKFAFHFETDVQLFPELLALRGVMQNPRWHGEGDVFVHTGMVCTALCGLEEWQRLTEDDRETLYLAALFHDIGKKICTKEEDGILVSPNHAIKGATIFRELFYRKYAAEFAISFEKREKIAALIRYHGLPLLFMEKRSVDRYLIEARETAPFPLLYLLAKADLLGRICRDQQDKLAVIDYFREYAKELGCYERPVEFCSDYSRFQFFRKDQMWHGSEIYDDTRFVVYVMAGLPLAGKDTYIESQFPDLPVISLDQIRQERGIDPAAGSGEVVNIAKERAKEFLRKEQSFVWNATNTVADTRHKVYRLCEAYGAGVVLVYLEVPYLELLKRNRERERKIPLSVLDHLIRKMEVPKSYEAYRVEFITKD